MVRKVLEREDRWLLGSSRRSAPGWWLDKGPIGSCYGKVSSAQLDIRDGAVRRLPIDQQRLPLRRVERRKTQQRWMRTGRTLGTVLIHRCSAKVLELRRKFGVLRRKWDFVHSQHLQMVQSRRRKRPHLRSS